MDRAIDIVGIDPGANGGIAFLDRQGRSIFAMAMPEESGFVSLCRRIAKRRERPIIYMEKVQGFIGVGHPGSRMFQFGEGYGFLRGVLSAYRFPVELVRPQEWQRHYTGLKNGGFSKEGHKRELKRQAQMKYPDEKVTLKTSDALLIAGYGWERRYGQYAK